MFIVLLKFAENKSAATEFMELHNQWLEQGFEDGVFLMTGSIQPNAGGSILAYNSTFLELETRINEDPFVQQNVVNVEIIEISPKQTDKRLEFLVA